MTDLDPRSLQPGDRLRYIRRSRNIFNATVTISHRKDDDSGWWLLPGEGGLADIAITSGDWELEASRD